MVVAEIIGTVLGSIACVSFVGFMIYWLFRSMRKQEELVKVKIAKEKEIINLLIRYNNQLDE